MKLRVVEISKLDSWGDEQIEYELQRRAWFKWKRVYGNSDKHKVVNLYNKFLNRGAIVIIKEIKVEND